MRRLALLPLLLLAGCGTVERDPIGLAAAAGPQSAELGWSETYGEGRRLLRFEVESFAVLAEGWTARIAIENATGIAFELGSRPLALAFGLMLFEDGSQETLDTLNAAGSLPTVRRATSLDPAPPPRLGPGERWEATIGAPGSLPQGAHVRVVFGTLYAVGEPPGELQPTVVWITDRSTRLL